MLESADEDDQLLRPYAHYWAYAVIQKGAFSPYLFDIKGQTPLRMTNDLYAPDEFWDLEYKEEPAWSEIQQDYDYVWLYQSPHYQPQLDAIADQVYQSDLLHLYKIRKKPLAPPRKVRKRPAQKKAVQ